MKQGRRPIQELDLAIAAARKAVELNGESTDATLEKARACHRKSLLPIEKEQGALLAEGLAATDQGLKVKADSGPLLAMKAVIQKAQSRVQKDSVQRALLEKESQTSWDKALEINPLLAREYGPALRGE